MRKLEDPITFEVVKNAFVSVADEMALTVIRTAHSEVVRDAMDFSTAVCDAAGRLVAQGLCIPQHLGAVPDAMRAVLTKYDGNINPGDVFVLNDPDDGGMQLQDLFMIKPIFHNDQRVGFAVCVAHLPDIGGRVPGSNAVDSTEIFQEGLQIPILKMQDGGNPNTTLLDIIRKNVRVPEMVLGDVRAELAACHIGEVGYLKLVERYGIDSVQSLVNQILDYTEEMVRAELRQIPDGTYEFTDYIDDDGFGSGPIAIKVAVTVDGDNLIADFTGTSPQVKSALNATMSFARSVVYTALKCSMNPEILSNEGFYRPIEVRAPRGTILNPNRPAPRAARGLTGFRAVDTVFGALAQALPGRIAAAGEGGATVLVVGGTDSEFHSFVFVEFPTAGWGARSDRDGVDGTSPISANLANVPVEEVELHQPIQIQQYGFVPDTGGPGKWRGSLSVMRELRFLGDEAVLMIRSDRRKFLPYGLAGGRNGTPSTNILNPGETQTVLPTKVTVTIRRGDILRHIMAGGGGYGNPVERDPELVLLDVMNEKLTADYASREYGVVVDTSRQGVDRVATRALRKKIRSERSGRFPASAANAATKK